MIKLRRIVDDVYEQKHNGTSPKFILGGQLRIIINNEQRRRTAWSIATTTLLGVLLCATAVGHEYTITVDQELSKMHVEARFKPAVTEISAQSQYAGQFLSNVRDCSTDKRIESRAQRLVLPGGGIRCLNYSFDLGKAAQAERLSRTLDSSSIVVSPTLWMWRPKLQGTDEIRVHFGLPEGIGVFVPWEPIHDVDDSYLLGASPESGTAMAGFGLFESITVPVAGAELTITFLNTTSDTNESAILEWVRETADDIALAYGRFPNPTAKVVVIPVGNSSERSDAPVIFGRVVRDGGETVELLINENRPIAEYYDDWTATHEFSHLMLPYLQRDQRWISEGFAQYYQNVLLLRAGRYTEDYAWQKLSDGFERGRLSATGLSPNEAATSDEQNTRMRVYWSGAALALMADVELRRRSGGTESLDTVLDRLQQCCLPSPDTWSGLGLFRKLDSLLDEPLFMDLYRQHADTSDFPDVRPLLRQLGVSANDEGILLLADTEFAPVRAAISAAKSR